MMKQVLFFFCALFFEISQAATCPPVVKEIEATYQKNKTVQAEFEQKTLSKALGIEDVSHGSLTLERPDKIRWDTETPTKNLLVGNGKKFWFYTPPFNSSDSGELIERKARDVKSQLAYALLAGRFSSLQYLSCTSPDEKSISLVPKKGSAGPVKDLLVLFDMKSKNIHSVEMHYDNGDRVSIRLTKIVLGAQVSPSLFHFDKPKNTLRGQNGVTK